MVIKTKKFRNIKITLLTLAFVFLFCSPAKAQDEYPKLANYFLKYIEAGEYDDLEKWDLLIFTLHQSFYHLDFIKDLREEGKIVLSYVYPAMINEDDLGTIGSGKYLYNNVNNNDWWLKDASGQKIEIWPDIYAVNITEEDWRDFNVSFIENRINLDKVDGIMYDFVDSSISHYSDNGIDINDDSRVDTTSYVNSKWQEGMSQLFSETRDEIGDKIIVINGNSLSSYQEDVNGRMFETFPTPWEGDGSWTASMEQYLQKLPAQNISEQIYVINTNTDNTGVMDNYRKMRFGLASTLLGDGYFSFDHGTLKHAQTWWYDEYDTSLGKAQSEPYNLLDKDNSIIQAGLWRRDFENGIVLVNSTNKDQTYVFQKEEFEKINGTQDRRVNDGSIINYVKVPAEDGIVLLKRSVDIENDSFNNGSFVRVFGSTGKQTRNGFFAYQDAYSGNTQILISDIDNDGDNETLVNGNGEITVYKNGQSILNFKPYDGNFTGEISFAVEDLNGDGTKEIITGAGQGGGPHVRIFASDDGRPLIGGFFAYDKNFRGGVNVAVMDLNGDGTKEIITGAGPGGGPHVRVFTKDGQPLTGGFFAYDNNFRGGVSVAVGNIDGKGDKEIITGAGPGGGPQVKVYSKDGKLLSQFMAYSENMTSGIMVMSDDINNDNIDDILVSIISF